MRSRNFVVAVCAMVMLLCAPRSFAAAPSTQPAPLEQSVGQVRASGAGLAEVINQLKQTTGRDILVNWAALGQVRVTRDLPVTIDLSGLPLGEALTRLLDHVGGMYTRLVYEVDQQTIVISTFDEVSKEVVTRVYDVRAELKNEPAGKQKMQAIIRRVKGVAPLAWRSTGGYGAVDEFNGQLIVTQTPAIQQRIAADLQEMDASAPSKQP